MHDKAYGCYKWSFVFITTKSNTGHLETSVIHTVHSFLFKSNSEKQKRQLTDNGALPEPKKRKVGNQDGTNKSALPDLSKRRPAKENLMAATQVS